MGKEVHKISVKLIVQLICIVTISCVVLKYLCEIKKINPQDYIVNKLMNIDLRIWVILSCTVFSITMLTGIRDTLTHIMTTLTHIMTTLTHIMEVLTEILEIMSAS